MHLKYICKDLYNIHTGASLYGTCLVKDQYFLLYCVLLCLIHYYLLHKCKLNFVICYYVTLKNSLRRILKKTLFLVFESAIVICRTFAPINFNFCKNLVILKKRRNYKITGKVKKKSIFRHKSVIRVFHRTV